MPKLSELSESRLSSCHQDLRLVIREAIKLYDFSVLCGYRTKEEQEEALKNGFSTVDFPNSKHNTYPSTAIDLAPYPINWNDTSRFYYLAGIVMAVAASMGIKIRWGGDFNQDSNFKNDKFKDLPHFELVTT